MDLPPENEDLNFPDDSPCFGCSASHPTGLRLRFQRRGETIRSTHSIPDRFQGAPGIAHGGVVATMLDEVSCAVVAFLRGTYVVTGELSVRYRRPVLVEQEVTATARVTGEHPRYLIVEADLCCGDEVLAHSTGKFFPTERPTAP